MTESRNELVYVDGAWQIREITRGTDTMTIHKELSRRYTTKAWALQWASTHLDHVYINRYYNRLRRAVNANEILRLKYGGCILETIPEGDGEEGTYTFRVEFTKPRTKKEKIRELTVEVSASQVETIPARTLRAVTAKSKEHNTRVSNEEMGATLGDWIDGNISE